MAYPFDETFATGIPPGFGANGGGGGITATWNSTAQSVDLVFPAAQSFWKLTLAPQASDFWCELDVEILAATGNPHFGFWLWDGVGTYEGHRLCVLDGYWTHSRWSSGGAETESVTSGYAAWAIVGGRRTLRLEVRRSANGLWRQQLAVDGVVVWADWKRWFTTFQPAVFGYATTLRLHRAAGGTPTSLPEAPPVGAHGFTPQRMHRILVPEHAAALRFLHRGLGQQAILRNHYYAGAYRIAGTVKEKNIPVDVPVSRRVLLFDERANVVVRETWSDAVTGAYTFEHLNPDIRYLVIAYDHRHNYRAVIADNLTAEPMQ